MYPFSANTIIIGHISTDDNRDIFRDDGGIGCLLEFCEKHKNLVDEIISRLMKVINFIDSKKHSSHPIIHILPHFLT